MHHSSTDRRRSEATPEDHASSAPATVAALQEKEAPCAGDRVTEHTVYVQSATGEVSFEEACRVRFSRLL